ncbi:sensor histidine kinase [Paenibacillus mucilaginosus]|uniref:Sensor histidine kinase n=2 Tax=Paenibacillus mucilaginosus TaxID=61624 RepID=I0BVE4_9BACL|nr:sensor histidine kinase [Paenibacillus mucilaginosus]AEI46415.1 two-component sensor histidine kinase [Paenibacillus mucilaginosus KNP414]AFH66341.1 sensor histidine kinase [Paenibacillus mucilaginosus K02]MCG7213476.1 GHKL domain-containing protein [Paenibacillus mucilaginosus]WDM27706.1 GHKL domain-containing protein [Paenibacillus mucilaginosus]
MDFTLLMLNAGVAVAMALQANFYFNSVFGKESSKPAKSMYIIGFIILDVLYLTVSLSEILSSLIALAFIFCLSLGYETELKLQIMFSLLYTVLFTLINSICISLIDPSMFLEENSTALRRNGQLVILLSCILMIAVVYIIRFLAKHRTYTLNLRYFLLFISVPVISTYQVNVLSIYSEKNLHFFLSIFGLIVLNILVVYVLDTVIAKFQLLNENNQLQKQMDYQNANYEKTVHSFKKVKSIIHDTNQQFLYVAECIERGRTAEASEHIRVTLNKIEAAYHRVNTGNLVIDALVTNALNIGQANGIRIDTELHMLDHEAAIERYDLCVALGNMLDNAIEASKRVKITEDRHIRIYIRSSDSALYIRVRNYVDREVTDLRSRKAIPDHHGYGLTNIERICEKYGGHMTIETGSHMFDNMVFLPFQAKESPA